MNLIVKFNLVLLGSVAVGLAITATIAHQVLYEKARTDTVENARALMEMANATRSYTSKNIKPLLETQMKYVFLPESVPAFGATEVLSRLREINDNYHYREAVLNPTNPRDRATDWQADIVNRFRNGEASSEILGERDEPNGRSMYLARPIKITDASCLQCHSTPDAAPRPMVEKYGVSNGFGWQMNEIVGAQFVSVPTKFNDDRAAATFRTLMISIATVFAIVFVVINAMLTLLVIRPVTHLAAVAEQASLGNDSAEFKTNSKDEIGALARAFGRMRISLKKAMTMIDE